MKEQLLLTEVTEYLYWNGTLRAVEGRQPVQGEARSAAFIHPAKAVGNSPYLYIDLEIRDMVALDDQTTAVGTAIFEGSRLWKKIITALDEPDKSKFQVKESGELTVPLHGAFVTVELEDKVERWWQRTPLQAGQVPNYVDGGQWTIVESVQVYISKGDDLKKAKGKAARSIENRVADPNNKEYRAMDKKPVASDLPIQGEVNKDIVGG